MSSQNSTAIGCWQFEPEKRVAATRNPSKREAFPEEVNVVMLRRRTMNERYGDMRKLALLARKKIGQKRLLSETDRLLRNSRDRVPCRADVSRYMAIPIRHREKPMRQASDAILQRLGKVLRRANEYITHEPLPRRLIDLIKHLEENERARTDGSLRPT
jgi:hypothetical protein